MFFKSAEVLPQQAERDFRDFAVSGFCLGGLDFLALCLSGNLFQPSGFCERNKNQPSDF